MLLIENKVIKEDITKLRAAKSSKLLDMICSGIADYLEERFLHSKEVEVVDMQDKITDYFDCEIGLKMSKELHLAGYKLIKIK